MLKRTSGRGLVACLAAALLAVNLGCNAASNTGPASGSNKPSSSKPQDTKSATDKTPKADPG